MAPLFYGKQKSVAPLPLPLLERKKATAQPGKELRRSLILYLEKADDQYAFRI